MPELPEVESVRRALTSQILGRTIHHVWWSGLALRRPFELGAMRERLVGASFDAPRRVGKYLLLDLEGFDAGSVMVHLGMSGRLSVTPPDAPHAAHTHVVLGLDDGHELRYVDPRRFGLVVWIASETQEGALQRMGPDPLAQDFVPASVDRIKSKRGPIKHVIMDQSVVAGVGNIYACEALWRAGIRPSRAALRVSKTRLAALSAALVDILRAAIDAGGTTLRDHATPDGAPGGYAVELDVYGREGEGCIRCESTIQRSVMGGRSTFWCPGCQR